MEGKNALMLSMYGLLLKNNGIFCTAVVVTRYFGGVKLGTGGLVRAYQGAVVKILNDTGVAENLLSNLVSVDISYNLYPVLLKFLDGIKHKNSNTEYLNEGVKVEFYIPIENLNSLQIKVNDITSGKGKMQVLQTEFAEY
jgi:putative IMPACT (imprinted ancient) family translation regulator